MSQRTSIFSAGRATSRATICFAFCIGAVLSVNGQDAKLLNVQPAVIEHGEIMLYGVIRELPENSFFQGTVLAVQVTASDSDRTTESRRDAHGAPCAVCTTMHYFLVGEDGEETPDVLYRTAPGPVTYIHINKKEYMLGGIALEWVGDKPQLRKVTLLQTGFAPPLFKRRINIRFEDPIEFKTEAEKVADMAMRDAFIYTRPVTLRKVFPPDPIQKNISSSE